MLKVGILRGGQREHSDHYEKSLRDSKAVIDHLLENLSHKYKVVDIFIDRDGAWHAGGLPVQTGDLVHKADVVWNLSHPSYSNIIESFSIPSIGVPTFSSVLHKSRDMLKEHMKAIGVNMPRHMILPLYQADIDGPRDRYIKRKAMEVFEKFGSPWIVRSATQDGDMGVHVANTFPDLMGAIADGVNLGKGMLVEELISGRNATFHTVPGFRGEDVYTMSHDKLHIDEKEMLGKIAQDLHEHLDAKNYLQSDFVIHPKRGIFVTNFSFHPDLSEDSHFCRSCESIGAKAHHLIEHIIEKVRK